MEKIIEILETRINQLLKIKQDKEKSLKRVPEGTLRISAHENKVNYYRKNANQGSSTYLRKKEIDLVRRLAQKEYDQKVLRAVEKELGAIEKCLAWYPVTKAEEVYEKLHRERKKLVIPVWEPHEQFAQKWEAVVYEGKGFEEDAPEFYTAKNERVRSKSEWIIADLLSREGVPYRYEYPLYLKGMGVVHPDFMVLNVKERKEFYWEHLGMMDDSVYVERVLQKIALYEQNGIYPGEGLILTYETKMNPLNQKVVTNMIEHYLK